jgi:hypothetical protein
MKGLFVGLQTATIAEIAHSPWLWVTSACPPCPCPAEKSNIIDFLCLCAYQVQAPSPTPPCTQHAAPRAFFAHIWALTRSFSAARIALFGLRSDFPSGSFGVFMHRFSERNCGIRPRINTMAAVMYTAMYTHRPRTPSNRTSRTKAGLLGVVLAP